MARQVRGLAGCDQWIRAAHTGTTVDGETGLVSLSWQVTHIGEQVGAASRWKRHDEADGFRWIGLRLSAGAESDERKRCGETS